MDWDSSPVMSHVTCGFPMSIVHVYFLYSSVSDMKAGLCITEDVQNEFDLKLRYTLAKMK